MRANSFRCVVFATAISCVLWLDTSCDSDTNPVDSGVAPDTGAVDSGDVAVADVGIDHSVDPAAGDIEIIEDQVFDEEPDATEPFSCPATPIEADDLDQYGGWTAIQAEATGFFRVEQVQGRWALVTPEGHPFFSTGVNGVSHIGTRVGETREAPYHDAILEIHGSDEAWAEATKGRLWTWGFNTVGAWSKYQLFPDMPYTVILGMSGSSWLEGDIPDYWSDEFQDIVDEEAQDLASRVNDPFMIGYFLDNEVRWGADHRVQRTLFEDYLKMAADAPGKVRLVAILEECHEGSIEHFNEVWETDLQSFDELLEVTTLAVPPMGSTSQKAEDMSVFLTELASQFFEVTGTAAGAVDPNHLNLGVRFVSTLTPAEVVEASGSYVDVCSVNYYDMIPLAFDAALALSGGLRPDGWLLDFHRLSGRPLMITEFGFRARDSGLPNSWPPIYPTLDTQEDRADGLERYALSSYATDYTVGCHWFIYADQPAEGRFDGEDNNFGLVDINDQPYEAVTSRATELHSVMYPCIWQN